MLDLDHYQKLFDITDTAERCRKVLDEVDKPVRSIFEQFVEKLSMENTFVHSYASTLQTTYHDASSEKHSEEKKDSSIGRKYFVQWIQKVNDQEVNLLTCELNGIEERLQIYVETNFYSIWEGFRQNSMNDILNELSDDISIYFRTGSFTKGEVNKNELEAELKAMLKPRKRPWISFGFMVPLAGELTVEELLQLFQKGWDQLQPILNYMVNERDLRERGNHILNLLKNDHEEQEITLLNHKYKLNFQKPEKLKPAVEFQSFTIKDQDQLLFRGHLFYYEFHEKHAPYQVISLKIDGHTHIYTSIRILLSREKYEWWIKKSFTTHSLNNSEITEKSLKLLSEHGIETNNNEYKIGTYNNKLQMFEDDISDIKLKIVTAALIFAHCSERIQVPTEIGRAHV